jgi:hypothetical protein
MKLIVEYWAEAMKFQRMSDDSTDEKIKAALRNQADAYRKFANKRAIGLGLPIPEGFSEPK